MISFLILFFTGVSKAIANVNDKIAKELIAKVTDEDINNGDQSKIDNIMLALDGTDNKGNDITMMVSTNINLDTNRILHSF